MLRQSTLLWASASLVALAGCSSEESPGGVSAGPTAGVATGNEAVGGAVATASGGESSVVPAGGTVGSGGSASAVTGGSSTGVAGSSTGGVVDGSTGGTDAVPITGGTPSTGGVSEATGGVYVPATGGTIDYTALIPADALTAEEPVCGVQDFELETQPAEVLLLLDRSSSMSTTLPGGTATATRWEAIVPTVASVVESTGATLFWGLKFYPLGDNLEMCVEESIAPTIQVPVAQDSASAVIAAIEAEGPNGRGTPTGDAVRAGIDHLVERAAVSPNLKYLLLATDGEPTCPQAQAGSVQPIDYAVEQITAALDAGFPTFVLGVDTTSPELVANLNAMAVAGGRPQEGASQSFYLASTQAELDAALQAIAGEIASCVFDLNPPPPVPDNIAVDFSGSRVDQDPSRLNGWDYTADDYTQLEVFGTWCERIQTEAMNRVNIKYGCPGVPIPLPE